MPHTIPRCHRQTDIALRFNKMVRDKEIGPVMLGRDHHDTGGTDSPFRKQAI